MGQGKDSNGIWGHSSAIGANEYYIFAVGDQTLITEKAFQQWCKNCHINYKPLVGSYAGKTEHSYIIGAADIIAVAIAGWLNKQESILHLGACDSRDRRKATLFYLQEGRDFNDPSKETVDLGVFQSVSREEAMQQAGWTYDPSIDEYFICKDPDEIKLDDAAVHSAWDALGKVRQLYVSKDEVRTVIKQYLKDRRTI